MKWPSTDLLQDATIGWFIHFRYLAEGVPCAEIIDESIPVTLVTNKPVHGRMNSVTCLWVEDFIMWCVRLLQKLWL